MNKTKDNIIELVDLFMNEGVMKPSEISRYTRKAYDLTAPEDVRAEMEDWFRIAGIEHITGKQFSLAACPFSEAEIIEIYNNDELIICIPKDLKREEIGKLFHLESWSLTDSLVTRVTEQEDLWFRTSKSLTPIWMNQTGVEVSHQIVDKNAVHFCLERYMVFIARMRYLTGHTPDSEYWVWMTAGRYDRSGMLMAGIDRNKNFNVHGWMPQFNASYLGGRYGMKPKQDN